MGVQRPKRQHEKTQKGSIFTVLFVALAALATLSFLGWDILSGPVSSNTRISQQQISKSKTTTMAGVVTIIAGQQAAFGDCDGDGAVEPPEWRATAGDKPTNGGLIPTSFGADIYDLWGMDYGYCVWDVGFTSGDSGCGGATAKRLDGTDDPLTGDEKSQSVIAVISAGPNRDFETSCAAYVDATTGLVTPGGDDIVKVLDYLEASTTPYTPWIELGDPCTLPWGGSVRHGQIALAYLTSTPPCTVENRVCDDGTLLGSYTIPTCNSSHRIRASADHSCDIKADGTAWCWGYGVRGSLGQGAWASSNSPVQVSGAGSWAQISVGGDHTCGIKTDDTLWCWGWGSSSQLGTPSGSSVNAPDQVLGNWTDVATGVFHTCAIKTDGTAWCWGSGFYGQLGHGVLEQIGVPQEVTDLPTDVWVDISAGYNTSCGIKSDGTAWCWGQGDDGELGNNSSGNSSVPVEVHGGSWVEINTGSNHVCALKPTGSIWCWGSNYSGELGIGSSGGYEDEPVEVSGGDTWMTVSPGRSQFTCGVKTDGTAWCWGTGYYGNFGRGSDYDYSYSPAAVSGAGGWTGINTGEEYVCGVKSGDSAWCWGGEDYGELGNGSGALDVLNIPDNVEYP